MFWFFAFVMVAFAIAFIVLPLFRQSVSESVSSQANSGQKSLAVMTGGMLIFLIPLTVFGLYLNLGDPGATSEVDVPEFMKTSQGFVEQEQTKQVDDVETLFEKLKLRLEKNPDDAAGWKMMGLSYMHFKQFQQALAAYQKAAELLPEDESIQTAIDRAKLAIAEGESVDPQQKITKTMIAPNGQTVDVGAMVERLQRKLEKNPDNLSGWMMLGRSYSQLGLHKNAVDAYQNALKLNPTDQKIQAALAASQQAAVKM